MPTRSLLLAVQQPTCMSCVKTGEISRNFHAKISQLLFPKRTLLQEIYPRKLKKPLFLVLSIFNTKKLSYFLCIDFTPTLISTSFTSTFFSTSLFCRNFFGLVLIFASISKSRSESYMRQSIQKSMVLVKFMEDGLLK